MTQDGGNGGGVETTPQELGGAGNVDKIREILFGGQMRDYDRKFARLEERLLKDSGELREDLKRRFEALETYIEKEVDSLGDRLKSEQGERVDAVKELAQELKALTKTFEKRTAQLDEQTTKAQRELRQQMFEQSKNLGDDIRQKAEELAALVAREAQELRAEKTDRAALALLLTEMAMRLNNEFALPKTD